MHSNLDPVTHALLEVKDNIPPEVLQLVFKNSMRGYVHMNVNHPDAALFEVRQRVIEQRIRRAVDALGALEVTTTLQGLSPELVDRYTYIWRIPKARTNGRTITSALALTYGSNGSIGLAPNAASANFNVAGCGTSQYIDAANRVMNSQANLTVNQTANCTIIGDNVVMVQDYQPVIMYGYLRCMVGADSEFSHIKPHYKDAFAELVIEATKAYIYNNYRIDLGQGFLSGGAELPQVRDVIEGYADAEQNYRDLKKRWRKQAMMNDGPRYQRFIRAKMGAMY